MEARHEMRLQVKVRVRVRLKGGQCKYSDTSVCVCVWIVRQKPSGSAVVSVAVWQKQLLLPAEGKLVVVCL